MRRFVSNTVFLGFEWKAFFALSPILWTVRKVVKHSKENMDLQSFISVEANPGGGYPISLVVGDNFNTASLVDSVNQTCQKETYKTR